jgi:hypothetical protein
MLTPPQGGLSMDRRPGSIKLLGAAPLLEFFDALGFRVDALTDGEHFHVSMLHVPFGRGNAQRQTHSETSSNYLCTNHG